MGRRLLDMRSSKTIICYILSSNEEHVHKCFVAF